MSGLAEEARTTVATGMVATGVRATILALATAGGLLMVEAPLTLLTNDGLLTVESPLVLATADGLLVGEACGFLPGDGFLSGEALGTAGG